MITITFEYTEDKKNLILNVKGHAATAEKGKDLVCAAASILATTLAQCVRQYADEGKTKKKPTIRLNEGDACITCKPRKDVYSEALHSFYVIQTGYALLAAAYPDYVTLNPFTT